MPAFRVYGDNILKTVGGFFLKGDPRWHYNLPGKPSSTAHGSGFRDRHRRSAEAAEAQIYPALIWTRKHCLPAILTVDLMPQGQRELGITPPSSTWRRWDGNAPPPLAPPRPPLGASRLALVVLLAFEGGNTVRTYFGEWVGARRLRDFQHGMRATTREAAALWT